MFNIIDPIFKNYIAIALSSSNEYVPYLSVCLQSLKEHTSLYSNYDIIIFERNITEKNKNLLIKQMKEKNISLRFVNPECLLSEYHLKFPDCYSLECYFRLVAPLVLRKYKKIIFTDVDLIFQKDITNLYNIDIENYPLGAAQDYIWSIFINTPYLDWKEYCDNVLQLKEPLKYFNTGVMLINIEEFNKNEYSKQLLSLVSQTYFKILAIFWLRLKLDAIRFPELSTFGKSSVRVSSCSISKIIPPASLTSKMPAAMLACIVAGAITPSNLPAAT